MVSRVPAIQGQLRTRGTMMDSPKARALQLLSGAELSAESEEVREQIQEALEEVKSIPWPDESEFKTALELSKSDD